jgi:drug/metabolite transporter (DMT)-like permease
VPPSTLLLGVYGLFGLVSGLLALACHALLEAPVALVARDWALIVAVGVGPLGAAFFFWDAALKRSDARRVGLLSYLTPLASTLLLAATSGRALTAWTGAAALLIVGAALVGLRTR